MNPIQPEIEAFFQHYRDVFNSGLRGELDPKTQAGLYAKHFVGSSPRGIAGGKNGLFLKLVTRFAYARYRKRGMDEMQLRGVAVTPVDDMHKLAKVSWRAVFAPGVGDGQPIDFDNHYLVRRESDGWKVFAWTSEDEEEAMRRHGVIA
jgi:hypothetical protein